MAFSVDPEYSYLTTLPTYPFNAELLPQVRKIMLSIFPACPSMEGVNRATHTFHGPEGSGVDNSVIVYTPEAPSSTPRPALVWIHGGGLVAGDAEGDHYVCSTFAKELGIVVISANYRLAPEHAYPAAIDDLYNEIRWIHKNSDILSVDVNRIAVGGASAGGGLAAALAQMVRDRAEFKFVFQYLVYPMLDDRTSLKQHQEGVGKYVWTIQANTFGWQSYLGNIPIGDENVPPYAAASRAKSLTGLPPAFISVGELDLFRDEDIEYAQRLWKEGISCELIVYPGVAHGFNTKIDTEATKNFETRSFQVLRKALFQSSN